MECWFCGKEQGDPNKSYIVEMFGDVVKSHPKDALEGVVQEESNDQSQSIAYNRKTVVIPRCANCKSKQAKAKSLGVLSILFLLVTAVLGILELISIETFVSDLLRGFSLGVSTMFMLMFLLLRLITLKGTQTIKQARKKYPKIKELLENGYEFGSAPKVDVGTKVTVEEAND